MAGTVSGTYELNAGPALSSLATLRQSARQTQTSFHTLGNTIDHTVSDKALARMEAYGNRISEAGDNAVSSNAKIRESFRQTESSVKNQIGRIEGHLTGLNTKLRETAAIQATPEVELRGVAQAIAEVKVLRAELRELRRESVGLRLTGAGGGGLGGIMGGGARGSGGGGGRAGVAVGSGGLNVMGLGLGSLAAAAAVALPAIQSLAGAVTALAGSLGAAALGAGAVGVAGIGALGVGIGTIASVAIPMSKNVGEAAKALEALDDAQRDATAGTRAHSQMVYQARQAEQQLANSQRGALRAQQALTQARRDARRELTDLDLAARSAALGERGAAITLARARENLARTSMDPMTSVLDQREAALAVEQAQLGVTQARVQRRRSIVDRDRARRRGIEGAPGVVGARDSLRASRQAVQGATYQLREARQQITEGTNSVDAAKRALDRALARAPRGTMALIRDARAFGRAWRRETAGAQENLISLAREAIRTGRRMTPSLASAAQRSTGALRRETMVFLGWMEGPARRRFLRTGAAMFDENLGNARRFTQGALQALMNLAEAARPFLREFTQYLDRMANGWARNTSNIDRTRGRIGSLIDHFRSWWRLTRALARLLGTIFSAGAPSGRSMVEHLTETLDRWNAWMRRNPERVRDFFRRSVRGAESVASALANIVSLLDSMATALQPVLRGFETLTRLLTPLATLAGPVLGAAATGFGVAPLLLGGAAAMGLRGRRGTGGGGGAGGGGSGGGVGGLSSFLFGAAGAAAGGPGARQVFGGLRGAYGVSAAATRAAGAGPLGAVVGGTQGALSAARRAGGLGSVARIGVGAATRFALPLMALQAGLSALTTPGTFGERGIAAANALSFGLIPSLQTGAQARAAGQDRAHEHIGRLASGGDLRSLEARAAALRRGISGAEGRQVERGPGLLGILAPPVGMARLIRGRNAARQAAETEREYRTELRRTERTIRDVRRAQADMMNQRSRERGEVFFGEFQEGFGRRSRRVGPARAARQTVDAVMEQMGRMRRAGARVLAEQSLDWLNQQRRANPKLIGAYQDLRERIIERYRRMGIEIAVINGQILDGSQTQWARIADSLSSAARRGVDRTGAEFRRLREMALRSLELMGMTRAQARSVLRGTEAGDARARETAGAYSRGRTPAGGLRGSGRVGGGAVGDGPGRTRGRGSRGGASSPALLGAKAALAGYAGVAGQMGLRVSSGLRPGAITSSGNPSFHGTGDALDVAGSPANMMRFFRYAARHWGSHLEELIYTPGGRSQIKNGRPFVYTGQVAADHHDHVHIADTSPSLSGRGVSALALRAMGLRGAGAVRLRARRSGLGGVPGVLVDRGTGVYASALTDRVNAAAGLSAGAVGTYSGRGRGVLSQAEMNQLLSAAGLPPVFLRIARAESGWNPRARNPSGASGLFQIMMPLHAGLVSRYGGNVFDPLTNARVARHLYNASGLSPWTASRHAWGDGIGVDWGGWNARGGSFRTRPGRPAIFGAGEGGVEDVTIRPRRPRISLAGLGGGPSVSVSMTFGDISVGGAADLKSVLDKAADHAAKKILDALDRPPHEEVAV